MKDLFPESRAVFEATKSRIKETAIGTYRARLGELHAEKSGIESEITQLQVALEMRRQRMNQRFIAGGSAVLALIGMTLIFKDFFLVPYLFSPSVTLGVGIVLLALLVPAVYAYRRFGAEIQDSEEMVEEPWKGSSRR
jgi:hypothetical protein